MTRTLPRLSPKGRWFVDDEGRRYLLRGVNLGGDCKVPYPGGGTYLPTDFSDHKTVSFIGRPFPLSEADAHLGRLRDWGFTVLRLLTTWEAVAHAGPDAWDTDYLDYFMEIVRKAGEHGLYVFVDFHQDVWSRMTGGDGAPGWTFEAVGLDMSRFHAADAAHVMQHKYDFSRGGRQEDRYPTMTWSQNYRYAANAIMWTLFFGGRTITPEFRVDGVNVQDYLQGAYLAAMRAVAQRVAPFDHVLGFDTLNEPGTGWLGRPLTYRHTARSDIDPSPVTPGPALSCFDALATAAGFARTVPELGFIPEEMAVGVTGERVFNPGGVRIWTGACPFEAAGAYKIEGGDIHPGAEDFFRTKDDQCLSVEADFMRPFFHSVAETVRAVREDWAIFAELDPFRGLTGEGFPQPMPERTVNASHWYDVVTLMTKTFLFPTAFDPFTGKTVEGAEAIQAHYARQLERIRAAGDRLGTEGAPTLIGEIGIPFDLDGGAAYQAWADGDRSDGPWASHIRALDLMMNALDSLLLHATLWNYTASNRNDLAVGDQWNQEDLSLFSQDQIDPARGKYSGGRALKGVVRPHVQICAGEPLTQRFDRESGDFSLTYEAAADGLTEVFIPDLQYPDGFTHEADGVEVEVRAERLILRAQRSGPVGLRVMRA